MLILGLRLFFFCLCLETYTNFSTDNLVFETLRSLLKIKQMMKLYVSYVVVVKKRGNKNDNNKVLSDREISLRVSPKSVLCPPRWVSPVKLIFTYFRDKTFYTRSKSLVSFQITEGIPGHCHPHDPDGDSISLVPSHLNGPRSFSLRHASFSGLRSTHLLTVHW